MLEIKRRPDEVSEPIALRTKRDAEGDHPIGLSRIGLRSWVEALSRLAARREWVLDLLGEKRSAGVLRGLAASDDPAAKRLALSQLDRLPEWLDLITGWLDEQAQEYLVLEALNGVSRLTGPYAQLALRTYLHREVQRAVRSHSPAEDLWTLSLRIARWAREWSSLRGIRLDLADPRSTLAIVPESLRGFSRRVQAAGRIESDLARLLQTWPDSAGAEPLPNEPIDWHRYRLSVARADVADLPPTVAGGPSGTAIPKAA
jgi:hypothetical protein